MLNSIHFQSAYPLEDQLGHDSSMSTNSYMTIYLKEFTSYVNYSCEGTTETLCQRDSYLYRILVTLIRVICVGPSKNKNKNFVIILAPHSNKILDKESNYHLMLHPDKHR